jgi:hypothetical protein
VTEINAADAESVIASVLDPAVSFDVAPEMLGKIQTLATYKALTDESLADVELEALLAKATQLAESSS